MNTANRFRSFSEFWLEASPYLLIVGFLALIALEAGHLLGRFPWPGYQSVVNIVSYFYFVLWTGSILNLVRFGFSRPVLPILGSVAALIYGVLIRLGGGDQGYYDIIVALAMISTFVASFRLHTARKRLTTSGIELETIKRAA